MKPVASFQSICLAILVCFPALAAGAVTQTNWSTGDSSLPGDSPIVHANNLLHTSLASATRTGAGETNPGNFYFYRENDAGGYNVDLARLYDGQFGASGSSSSASVLPNKVSLTFAFNLTPNSAGYNLSTIRTYAGWDSGRDGQQYTVEYSTVSAPGTFSSLATVSRFDTTIFPLTEPVYNDDGEWTGTYKEYEWEAATLVQLRAESGFLAENVAALRFNFTGFGDNGNAFENGGTGFREFVVQGAAAEISAVPEPSALFGTMMLLAAGVLTRRRAAGSDR
jgi:hypothetical protein